MTNIIRFPRRERLVEGNPELIDEHPVVLHRGALVYFMNTKLPMVDIVLSGEGLCLPTMYDSAQTYDRWWSRIREALIEVSKIGEYPEGAPSIPSLLRTARNHFENSRLFDELLKSDRQVRLCIRSTFPTYMSRHESRPGLVEYVHDPGWHFEVIHDKANAYPKPDSSGENK